MPFNRSMPLFAIFLVTSVLVGLVLPANAEIVALVEPHNGITYYDTDNMPKQAAMASSSLTAHGITFNITYADNGTNLGFDDPSEGTARKAALEGALTYIADVINATGTLDVEVRTSLDNNGISTLASAGTFYTTSNGFFDGATFIRINSGTKPFPGTPEISMQVNWGYSFNVSNDPPGAGIFDLLSLLVHELTHGLGFTSLIKSDGTSEFQIDHGTATFTSLAILLFRRTTPTYLLAGNPPSLQGNVADLIGGDIAFDGSTATSNYGSAPPIYAPNPYSGGSSMSHWDTGTIVGNPIMKHSIPPGVSRRTYAPVDVGALIDMGYTNASTAGVPSPTLTAISGEGEGEGEGEKPKDPVACGVASSMESTLWGDGMMFVGVLLLLIHLSRRNNQAQRASA